MSTKTKKGAEMKLTKRKALKICKELWEWLAENPDKQKIHWPDWEKYGEMSHGCPCCEYRDQRQDQEGFRLSSYCEKGCLVAWANNDCLDGEFVYWCNMETRKGRTIAALAIVKLCDKAITKLDRAAHGRKKRKK